MVDIANLLNDSSEDFAAILESVRSEVAYTGFFMSFEATALQYKFETKPELQERLGTEGYRKLWNERLVSIASVDRWDQVFTARYLAEAGIPLRGDIAQARRVAKLLMMQDFFEEDMYDNPEPA